MFFEPLLGAWFLSNIMDKEEGSKIFILLHLNVCMYLNIVKFKAKAAIARPMYCYCHALRCIRYVTYLELQSRLSFIV